ncbi:hypothetical protein [Ornithinibacillus sp. 179-J 7C1 HS]|uniref:hypothetical protein n=1 Tax=Ornithinibacillus sp. 179-J 7C1 HS TaxID=3142384 RepID=UPI0039A027F6
MLHTPLGPVKLFVNDEEMEYKAIRYIVDKYCRDVDGRYLIEYEYKNEYQAQKITCCIPSIDVEGDFDGGERLEAISFYKGFTKLTIGIVASFGLEEEEGYDFTGNYIRNGLEYVTNGDTADRIFQFGISWIGPYTEDNEYQTSSGADPSLMPTRPIKEKILSEEELLIWYDIIMEISQKLDLKFPYANIALNYNQLPIKIIVLITIAKELVDHNEIEIIVHDVIHKYLSRNLVVNDDYEIIYEDHTKKSKKTKLDT